MPAVHYLVDDVDAALVFVRALCCKLDERWGPPFAIVGRMGLRVWLSGPGTSARRPLAGPGGRQVPLADPSGNLLGLFEPERKLE